MENKNIIDSFIEIETLSNDDFLKVKETLTRIGIASRKQKEKPILWQSCHVLHKNGKYYIVHFKQMFMLDGKFEKTKLSEEDIERTQVIANLLQQWGLIKIKKPLPQIEKNVNLVVIPYKEKDKWNLKNKYSIGNKR